MAGASRSAPNTTSRLPSEYIVPLFFSVGLLEKNPEQCYSTNTQRMYAEHSALTELLRQEHLWQISFWTVHTNNLIWQYCQLTSSVELLSTHIH